MIAEDGVAPAVGEGGRDGVAVADRDSRDGRRRRWRMEATVADRDDAAGMDAAVHAVATDMM